MSTKFSNIYWLGGGSGAGKSTIAQRLAEANGYELYSTDNVMGDHSSRCIASDCPYLESFKPMSMDERWVNRTPKAMLDTFHWFNGEGFNLIIEDLRKYPADSKVIVEGFRLLPKLVKPYLSTLTHGLWLIPTPEFRLNAFENRGTLWDIPNKTTQPDKALKNLLSRDAMFTDRLSIEAKSEECPLMVMDGKKTEDELVLRVTKHFGL